MGHVSQGLPWMALYVKKNLHSSKKNTIIDRRRLVLEPAMEEIAA